MHFIGAGGKTTLLFALAREATGRVICATTTRMGYPAPEQIDRVVIGEHPDPAALPDKVLIARARTDAKLLGHDPEVLDALRSATDLLLVEADGARRHPLKAHAPYEPVISPQATHVIAVLGASGLGHPAAEAVHRAERFCALVGIAPTTFVSEKHVATAFFHPEGFLAHVPPGAGLAVVIAQGASRPSPAVMLAGALRRQDRHHRIGPLLVAELASPSPWVLEC